MKKYWILFLLIPFLSIVACMDDTSAYLPQDKEEVKVENNFQVDTTDTDSVMPEGQLVPGVHLVKMKVLQPNYSEPVEREFKYYMPVTINPAKPISLIFDFHGSYGFKTGEEPANPISGISEGHTLNQIAVNNNCIVCFPAALPIYSADSSGTVNWMDSENHLSFVDEMVKYFTVDNEPRVDPNRIYSTGHSSGAIFSFVLAFERSNVFAAIAPRAGQMNIANAVAMPERAVPVRVFAGEVDTNVYFSGVLKNMGDWAERIGGYFSSDMQMDSKVYEGYADVTIRYWHGGSADYEIYSLAGIDHYKLSVAECKDDLWDFFETHPMDVTEEPLFINANYKDIDAQCGESFEIKLSYTEGATLEMPALPKGWTKKPATRATFDQTVLTLVAPKDYFGSIEREGTMTFQVSKNGKTATCGIVYHLNAPKTYFEVGDIYYNEDFEPVGVVCWVNPDNIREAKIVSLESESKRFSGTFKNGFATPDMNDGAVNTAAYLEENKNANLGSTAANSAIVWAAEYSYKGVDGWYLPAINELVAIHGNKAKINSALSAIGGAALPASYCLSSTIVVSGTSYTYYELNFDTGSISREIRTYSDPFFAIKVVSK